MNLSIRGRNSRKKGNIAQCVLSWMMTPVTLKLEIGISDLTCFKDGLSQKK